MKKALIGAASVLTVGLAGCGDTDGYVINAAIAACKDHGGIHSLHPDVWARHARCNDGALVLNVERRPTIVDGSK